jgi:hypothetical protein
MKKQLVNKTSFSCNRYVSSAFYLLVCGTLVVSVACKKQTNQSGSSVNTSGLNAQEHTLAGKWALKKSETYEIMGIDSTGQYLCTLIGSSTCDSICMIEFKNEQACPSYCPEFKGAGSIGGCDPNTFFIWKAKQLNKLEIGSGSFYDIVYLSHDSVAFSNVYKKDILTLKSVVFYKRK